MVALMCRVSSTVSAFLCIMFAISSGSASNIENSIARLNYAGFSKWSYCTASLISQHSSLTAKHCIRPTLHLLFGYSKGGWIEHRVVSKYFLHPTKDIAILCFNERSEQLPLELDVNVDFPNRDDVSIYGYPLSRSHLLLRKECKPAELGGGVALNCPVERGMSGGPVLGTNNKPNVQIGILSRTNETSSQMEFLDDWVTDSAKACTPLKN